MNSTLEKLKEQQELLKRDHMKLNLERFVRPLSLILLTHADACKKMFFDELLNTHEHERDVQEMAARISVMKLRRKAWHALAHAAASRRQRLEDEAVEVAREREELAKDMREFNLKRRAIDGMKQMIRTGGVNVNKKMMHVGDVVGVKMEMFKHKLQMMKQEVEVRKEEEADAAARRIMKDIDDKRVHDVRTLRCDMFIREFHAHAHDDDDVGDEQVEDRNEEEQKVEDEEGVKEEEGNENDKEKCEGEAAQREQMREDADVLLESTENERHTAALRRSLTYR